MLLLNPYVIRTGIRHGMGLPRPEQLLWAHLFVWCTEHQAEPCAVQPLGREPAVRLEPWLLALCWCCHLGSAVQVPWSLPAGCGGICRPSAAPKGSATSTTTPT